MNPNDLKNIFMQIESFPISHSRMIMSQQTYNDILIWSGNFDFYYICY